MSPEAFSRWLAAMKISKREAARRLGVHPNTVTVYAASGAPRHIGLACAALWHRLEVFK